MNQVILPLMPAFSNRLKSIKFGKILILILLFTLMMMLSACNLPDQTPAVPTEDFLASMVAATLQGLSKTIEYSSTGPTVTELPPEPSATPDGLAPSPTPDSSNGQVTGLVCYLESTSTNLVVYFQNTENDQVRELPISVSNYQSSYDIELQPGTYKAYAWTLDYSIGGTYSACGADSTCIDATPKVFSVNAGEKIEEIDICDWSHGPFVVPYPPGFQPEAKFGIISGEIIGYPYGGLPQLTIVAFNSDKGYWFWVGTVPGQSYFTLNDLPVGNYQVVAYDNSGHAGGTGVDIEIKGGQTTNATINNWSGSFPANPVK